MQPNTSQMSELTSHKQRSIEMLRCWRELCDRR